MKIPFSKNTFGPEEEEAIINCIRSGWVVLGPKTQEFEQKFANYVGARYAVFVDSGTSALFLAIRAAGYKDFVTISSLTFVSDAEVVHHAGLRIEYADIDRKTLCIDSPAVQNCLPTNFAGVKARADGLVVDSCHRIERNDVEHSKAMWCYSFYATKNMSTVQGGMIALNDKDKYEWLLKARDHGMTKGTQQRYQGKDPVYDVEFPGWRVKGDDFRAALGLVQLSRLPQINARRRYIVDRYNKNLGLDNRGNHLYPILVDKRLEFINYMHEQGVQTSIHFLPIHKFTAYKNEEVKLPVTEYVCDRIVSLPLFYDITDEEIDYISEKVLASKLLIIK